MAGSGNLQDLNPIVTPEAVGWLPLAPGWQILLVASGLLLLWLAWKWWLAWRDDQYRREALQELDRMSDCSGIPSLLKRAALSAYQREAIASLSGPHWHRFLDRSAGMNQFDADCGVWLDQVAYNGPELDSQQAEQLRSACRSWLKQHRRMP